MVAAAAASVLCCMGAVFPATIGVTAASADEPVELVVNGGFEDDLNGWKSGTVWNSSASSIAVTADDVHGGSGALSVTDRTSSDAGAIQSLDGKVEKGQTYTGSMWVKATEDGEFNITVCSGNGSGCDQIATGTAKAGEWTQISGTGTLGGSGDFTSPSLVIENKYGTSNADFIVDDISVTGSDSGSSFVPPTTGTATAAKAFGDYSNPIIDYWYGADPWAMEYNGRVYIYTTGDGTSVNADGSLNYDYEYDSTGQIKDNSFAQVKTINVLSSDDMVNWRNEGYIRVAGEQGVATWASNSWAPAVAHKTINGKEKFFLYFANGGSGIGVLTSDSPVGPWKDETGELLIKGGTPESAGVVWLFDPAVFVDDDGQGYLYYGGGVPTGEEEHPNTARVIKLSDDMLHPEGEAQAIDAPAMFEDSGIAKIGGTYYYSYCTNFSHDNVIDGNTVGVPVATLGIQLDVIAKTVNSYWYHRAEKHVEKREYKKLYRDILIGEYGFGRAALGQTLPVIIFLLFGEPIVQLIINYMPVWLTSALGTVSGVLPALGMALLMLYMPVKENFHYLLLGFVLYVFFGQSILAITLVGAVIAIVLFKRMEKESKATANAYLNVDAGGIGDE